MGTTAHVITLGGTRTQLDHARRRLEALERRWSRFLPQSELSELNARAGTPVVVSPETYRLIDMAVSAWRQTGGLFDPTIGSTMIAAGYDRSFPLLAAAGRDPGAGACADDPVPVPSPGAAGIVLDPYPGSVELPVGTVLDLGGIAKGAAADLVAEELVTAGAEGCCVNVGGDLRTAGRAPGPGGWQVRLDCPGGENELWIGLALGAVCTTTKIRRRWFTGSGVEHHLRDPASGASLETGLASVSVIGARAAQAEVLAKALFAGGPSDASMLARRWGVSGVVVGDDGSVLPLPGLERFSAAAREAG